MERCSVAVIGGGVVGAAVALALTRRGADVVLLEARERLGTEASGTNSGILHSGFDSTPGELETRLILRGAALRDEVHHALGVQVLRCGARVVPENEDERAAVRALAVNAASNGVPARVDDDGVLHVPGERVCDPTTVTRAYAAAAQALGARVRTGARVAAIERRRGELVLDGQLACERAINCAGLHADDIARLVGDASFAIHPRKGEFLVFATVSHDIRLPVPSQHSKGVLVFPTLDGHTIVGPTAVDLTDKDDWSVRAEAREQLATRAAAFGLGEPVHAYAGLRPAGDDGANYVIGPSESCPAMINVAAIRSTGLSASLGIGEHVADLIAPGEDRPLPQIAPIAPGRWWQR
jgi:glycerol-3-phosphate dehydrogenase